MHFYGVNNKASARERGRLQFRWLKPVQPVTQYNMAHPNKTIRNPKTGQEIRFIRTSRDTSGQLLEMEARFRAQSQEPVPHYHPVQAEDFTVLEGELTVRLNDQVVVLKQGSSLHISPNMVHSMWNASDRPAVVNWRVQPALTTEYFLETTIGLANDGKTDENGMPRFLQVALLANHFGNVFRLAKPPYWAQKTVFTLLAPAAWLAGYRPFYRQYLE